MPRRRKAVIPTSDVGSELVEQISREMSEEIDKELLKNVGEFVEQHKNDPVVEKPMHMKLSAWISTAVSVALWRIRKEAIKFFAGKDLRSIVDEIEEDD